MQGDSRAGVQEEHMAGTHSVDVAIAGGGIAGLSAAYHLGLHDHREYVVFEREGETGGIARSVQTPDGFTFDYGSHILYTSSPYVAALYDTLLGNNRVERQRNAWIFLHNSFTRYPFQANLYGLPPDVVYACLLDFITALNQPLPSGTLASLTFEEWATTTFGHSIAHHFILPHNRKLWCYPLHQMSATWVGNRVLRPKLEDVLWGALNDTSKGYGPNATFLYPATGGFGAIPTGLFRLLGPDQTRVQTGAEVVRIEPHAHRLYLANGERVGYRSLIDTLPLPALPALIHEPLPNNVQQAIDRLAYTRVSCLLFGIKGQGQENTGGDVWDVWDERMRLYLPEATWLPHRLGFPTAVTPTVAPDGWHAVYAEVAEPGAGIRHPHTHLSEEEMVTRTIETMRHVGIISPDESGHGNDAVVYQGRLVIEPAYPVPTLSHADDVATIHHFLAHHHIYPTGRFADWRYFNTDHTILSAKAVVEKHIVRQGTTPVSK